MFRQLLDTAVWTISCIFVKQIHFIVSAYYSMTTVKKFTASKLKYTSTNTSNNVTRMNGSKTSCSKIGNATFPGKSASSRKISRFKQRKRLSIATWCYTCSKLLEVQAWTRLLHAEQPLISFRSPHREPTWRTLTEKVWRQLMVTCLQPANQRVRRLGGHSSTDFFVLDGRWLFYWHEIGLFWVSPSFFRVPECVHDRMGIQTLRGTSLLQITLGLARRWGSQSKFLADGRSLRCWAALFCSILDPKLIADDRL